MTVNDVFKWLDAIAPFETQDEYDNAGLLTGSPNAEVSRVLFVLDVTRAAVAEAKAYGAELIVSHHPLMFNAIQQLRYDQGEGAVLKALAASGISLIAAHTNLDKCLGGIADSLADALELQSIAPSDVCPYLRTGTLQTPTTAKEFLSHVNRRLSAAARLYGNPGNAHPKRRRGAGRRRRGAHPCGSGRLCDRRDQAPRAARGHRQRPNGARCRALPHRIPPALPHCISASRRMRPQAAGRWPQGCLPNRPSPARYKNLAPSRAFHI